MSDKEQTFRVKLPPELLARFEKEANGAKMEEFLRSVIVARAAQPLAAEEPEDPNVSRTPASYDPARGMFVSSGFDWKWAPKLERAVQRRHVLVIAAHGLGKTFTIFKLAQKHGARVWYFTASHGLERGVLEGQYFPKPDGRPMFVEDPNDKDGRMHALLPGVTLQAVDGFVTSAIEEARKGPCWLVIDEFGFMPLDVQANLFAAMDTHQGIFSIAYRGAATRVSQNFRVIAATNPPSAMYPEVQTANRALLSRFARVLRIGYPDRTELAEYLGHLARNLAPEKVEGMEKIADRLIKFSLQSWQACDKGEMDNFVSPRDLKHLVDAISDDVPAEPGKDPKAGAVLDEKALQEAMEETIYAKFHPDHVEGLKRFWEEGLKTA